MLLERLCNWEAKILSWSDTLRVPIWGPNLNIGAGAAPCSISRMVYPVPTVSISRCHPTGRTPIPVYARRETCQIYKSISLPCQRYRLTQICGRKARITFFWTMQCQIREGLRLVVFLYLPEWGLVFDIGVELMIDAMSVDFILALGLRLPLRLNGYRGCWTTLLLGLPVYNSNRRFIKRLHTIELCPFQPEGYRVESNTLPVELSTDAPL